jgi:predicted metal-dependent phosphoesterase TrpH
MKNIIDLHTHSIMSDGSDKPLEIIRLASEDNIKAIALTDHDSIEGNNEAENEAKKRNIDFLPGIEISARYDEKRILHILGLGIDVNNKKFLEIYNNIKKAREESVSNIIKILKSKGIDISYDILKERCIKKYLDRYDIYNYFLIEKICSKPQEIWDKYLDPIPYGPDELMNVRKAIEIIREAGGISFLAHYIKKIGFDGYLEYEIEKKIVELINFGLDGIEEYYPDFSEENREYVRYLIEKYNLVSSGGTDFHGKNRLDIQLGRGYKNLDLDVPYKTFENIKNALENRKKKNL